MRCTIRLNVGITWVSFGVNNGTVLAEAVHQLGHNLWYGKGSASVRLREGIDRWSFNRCARWHDGTETRVRMYDRAYLPPP